MSQREELRDFEQKNITPGERATDDQAVELAIKSLEETLATKLNYEKSNPDAVEVEGDILVGSPLELSNTEHGDWRIGERLLTSDETYRHQEPITDLLGIGERPSVRPLELP